MVKNLPDNAGVAGDVGLTPGSGISLGGRNHNPFQDSCLETPMDRGGWGGVGAGLQSMGS